MTIDMQAERLRIAARNVQEQREHTREVWRDGILTGLRCLVWCACGVFLLGLAVHVTDYELGMVYFWSGLVVGYSGIAISLRGFFLRGEARGQW